MYEGEQYKEVNLLCRCLLSKFGLCATAKQKDSKRNDQWVIRFGTIATKQLLSKISQFSQPVMAYKFSEEQYLKLKS